MSETPQIDTNETIQINYTGTQINNAVGYALNLSDGISVAPKAQADASGNPIIGTYMSKAEGQDLQDEIDGKADKSRILSQIKWTETSPGSKEVIITGLADGVLPGDLVGDFVIPETIGLPNKGGCSVVEIASLAFENCVNITEITIPDTVITIGLRAFKGCTHLNKVTIGASVQQINNMAFQQCVRLSNIIVPDNLTVIGNFAFADCEGIRAITIPESVTSIGDYAFSGCTGLTSVNIPESLTSIGQSVFSGCTGLTSVNMDRSLTLISRNMFMGCSEITDVNIPEQVNLIPEGAFKNCAALNNVKIPIGVGSIEQYSFDGCSSLTDVYYEGTYGDWESIDIETSGNNYLLNATIHYNQKPVILEQLLEDFDYIYDDIDQRMRKYRILDYIDYTIDGDLVIITGLLDAEPTDLIGDFIIPETIEGYPVFSIGNGAFQGCSEITSIFLPNTIAYIDDYAFDGCIGLSMINIPNLVQSIGQCAFRECAFTDINIPESVIFIGDGAFQDCSALKNVTIYRHFSVYEPAPEIE